MKVRKLYFKIGLIALCVFFTSWLAHAQESASEENSEETIEELTRWYLDDLSCAKTPVSKGGRICRDATLYQQYNITVEYYYDGLSDDTIKIKKVRKLNNAKEAEKKEELLEFPVTEERRCIIDLADGRKILLSLDEQNQLKVKVYK